MAKNIALTLTLNGVEQTITSVQQLETAIKDARTALTSTFEGTQDELKAFNKQINDAQQSLDTLRNKKGNEENIKSIANLAKAGSAITSSFATASAAITLFGGDTEEISKAAAKAQSLLTIALGAREIAEGAVAVQTMVANAATALQTASTNAANLATKRFYATLAANPYIALAAAIGIVVGALIALNDEEDKNLTLQKELIGVRKNAAKELKAQLAILTDSVKTTNLELDAIEDLKKTYPGFNAFLNDNNQLTAQGITFLRAKIGLMEQEAVLQAVAAKKAEAEIKYQEKLAEINARKPSTFFGIKVGGGGTGLSFEQLQDVARAQAKKELEDATKGLTAAQETAIQEAEKYSGVIRQGNKILENQVDLEDKAKKAKDAAADAQKKLTEEYLRALDAQNEIIKGYGKINEGQTQVTNTTLENAKKLREEGKKLEQERQDFFTKTNNELIEQTQKLLFDIIPSGEQLKSVEDVYIELFGSIGFAVEQGAINLYNKGGKGVKLTLKEIEKLQQEAIINLRKQRETLLNDTKLNEADRGFRIIEIDRAIEKLKLDLTKATPEAQKALITFYQRLAQTAQIYGDGVKIADRIISPKTTDDITSTLLKAISKTETILNDPSILEGLKDAAITDVIKGLFVFPQLDVKKDFGGNVEAFKRYNEGVKIATENLVAFAKVEAEQRRESKKAAKELQEQTDALLILRKNLGFQVERDGPGRFIQLSQEQLTKYIDFVKEKVGQEPELLAGYLQDIFNKKKDLIERLGEQGVIDLFAGISTGFTDLKGKSEDELVKLIAFLETSAKDIETKFGKPAAKAFEDAANSAKKALSSIGEQKFLEQLQKNITEFISSLADLGSTISDFYSFQLSKLEKQNTDIQSKILGDSKRSNDKRIEQEEIYQKRKADLEKKAALRSLQISRATALANAAESITKIFAKNEPVSAAIFAAIATANNLVQVGIISAQIAELDTYSRGGRIKGQGGLVVGPAHEFGGVRYGAMGLELEGGESVINRKSSLNYQGLLSQINQSGGGRPLVNNTFDDSRILEALAKQKNEPIRAYVVEQDITNKQAITKRLEQLSQI